jgi:hypothetical protein
MNPPLSPGNASASRRKPKPARSRAVAEVVTSMTRRSDQAIALRRRLDAGDDTQPAAALPAGLAIDKVN